jgi:hypothetical protein
MHGLLVIGVQAAVVARLLWRLLPSTVGTDELMRETPAGAMLKLGDTRHHHR